ncbi:unannotated protein [freshwater metagenome]|uniref:Unannotated protein n=1 Tax=freshwater metagenome TaxID=449393 RepID=A0A6J5Z400_9ZZZZ
MPPMRSPIFARSAIGESSEALSSVGSGIGQKDSPAKLAAVKNCPLKFSSFVMTADVRVPSATTCAPVNVATSTIPSKPPFLLPTSAALISASAKTNLPSASGFKTSTVFPP